VDSGATAIASGLSASVIDMPDPSKSTVSAPTATTSGGVTNNYATVSGHIVNEYGYAVSSTLAVVSSDGSTATGKTNSSGDFQITLDIIAGSPNAYPWGTHSLIVKVDGVLVHSGTIGVGTAAESGSGSGGTPGLF